MFKNHSNIYKAKSDLKYIESSVHNPKLCFDFTIKS